MLARLSSSHDSSSQSSTDVVNSSINAHETESASKRIKLDPCTPPDTPLDDQPGRFGFCLTQVRGIHDKYNKSGGDQFAAVGIKDSLSERLGRVVESAQFNYMFDLDWYVHLIHYNLLFLMVFFFNMQAHRSISNWLARLSTLCSVWCEE